MKSSLQQLKKIIGFTGRHWAAFVVVILILSFLVLTYIAITPSEDVLVKTEGDAKVASLDIQFNKKLLEDLANTTKSATVTESGGRDPFSAF